MKLLSSSDVAKVINLSLVSVHRYGNHEKSPLKHKLVGKGKRLVRRYELADVKEFAERHGMDFNPSRLEETEE